MNIRHQDRSELFSATVLRICENKTLAISKQHCTNLFD